LGEIKTALFVVPRSSTSWRGNEAGWITTSGWASAGKQLWGKAWVITTDGIFTPEESMLFPRGVSKKVAPPRGGYKLIRKFVPEFFITALKDCKLKLDKPKVWPIETSPVLSDKVALIWERHDLFPGPGRKLADKLGVPFMISVEAPTVWEAKKWGVKRPVWGDWLEKNVEAVSLKSADLVSCVSEEVRDKVVQMGVNPEKVIVSHNRVDSSVFNPDVDGSFVREQYELQNKLVIGWTGSFRKFHGLDTVLHAFKEVNEKYKHSVLMLVGDGMEFEKIQKLAQLLGIAESVILPGKKPFTEVPSYLSSFDIALVSANSAEGFHYSPLKLREYLAVGKAVIAPRAGNLPSLFKDESDLLFYEAGFGKSLAEKMLRLIEDRKLHQLLVENATRLFEEEGTWLHEMQLVCKKLNIS
jgi:glycosyltransferase involved in cell wall biosynthesis